MSGASNPDDIAAQVIDSNYRPLPVKMSSTAAPGGKKQYKYSYTPETPGKHTVMVSIPWSYMFPTHS